MKLRVVFAVASIAAVLAALPARADEHSKRGDYDEHHGWHDADWWHDHHPGWLWQHHPEWAEHHREWRLADGDWDDHHHCVTGGSTSTRNWSRSITRIGSHGMTTGKTTITGMVIKRTSGAPVVLSPSPVDCLALI